MREIHISTWIIIPVIVLIIGGLIGIYYLKSNWKPDKSQKNAAVALRAENEFLENQHKYLKDQFDKLQERIKQLKGQEIEIKTISGVKENLGGGIKSFSDFVSFVISPFYSKKSLSVDKLIIDAQETSSYYDKLLIAINDRPKDFECIPSIWPCGEKFSFISFGFGNRLDPFTGQVLPHMGIDIPAPKETNVFAAGSGIISITQNNKILGKLIKINHYNGYYTVYTHLNQIRVYTGQRVRKGQIIGAVGSTGYTTGTHLHYEVIYKEVHQNPEDYLLPLERHISNVSL